MTKIAGAHNGDRIYLLAAAMAAFAAVFMVTVWGPLQVNAFVQGTQGGWAGTSGNSDSAGGTARWDHIPFVTADGNTTDLAASNGQVRVVTMMYTHCPGVCPLAISTLQRMDSRLTVKQRSKLSILALSLDPANDSVARLREFRDAHGITSPRWTVARSSFEGVEALAAALGIQYRLIADDTIDHQSVFVLIGKSGQVLARSSSTRGLDPEFTTSLQSALAGN